MSATLASKASTVRRRQGSRHDRTGCLTCRYRRKKCTENTIPVCGTCARLHLECIRTPPRNIVPLPVADSEMELCPSPPSWTKFADTWGPMGPLNTTCPGRIERPLIAGNLESLERSASTMEPSTAQNTYAMRYYISELAGQFSVSSGPNSFVSHFLPMAMESPALRNSLLALASSHISLTDANYRVAAIEAQNNALVHQKMSIVSTNRDACWSQDNAATCLVLATSLITTGDSKGWYIHMEGAKHFIFAEESQSTDGLPLPLSGVEGMKRTSEGRWVLRNFAYHDILGSITLRKRPLLEPNYLEDICHETDSYMGPGTILLKYIAQVQILNIDTQNDTLDKNFYEQWTHIEKDLNTWMPPVATIDANLISMVLAYRSVGLILLYRVVRKQVKAQLAQDKNKPPQSNSGGTFGLETLLDVLESRMSFQVAETIRHVSTIALWSAPEAGILFPLFIAGAESRSELQMGVIRTRLQQSLAKRMFRNIEVALDILEIVWGRRLTASSGEMDWEHILGEISCELVLT